MTRPLTVDEQDALAVAEAERMALMLDAAPGVYVHEDRGVHSSECWLRAQPLGECWGDICHPLDSAPVTLATFALAVGDAA